MARNVSFEVRPRYTPGSPGLVPEEVALTVASQERETFEVAREGVYGEAFQELAQKMGMAGIVERRVERAGGWDVTDLITGRTFRRETTKASKLQNGDQIVEIKSGREEGRWDAVLPVTALDVRKYSREVVVSWDRMVNAPIMFNSSDSVKIERDTKEN